MGPKYEFTDKTMNYEGHLLHRIRRLSDEKLGGWIEKEENLSQEGDCWVDDNAKVYGDAKVYNNAQVYGNAKVYSGAKVYNNAQVYGNATVFIDAKVYGNAQIYGKSTVEVYSHVYGNAEVCGHAMVSSKSKVYGDAQVYDNASVYGQANIYDNAQVYGNAKVNGAEIYGNIKINSGKYTNKKYSDKDDLLDEAVQDFIYKVDDSNKIVAQTEYDSVDEFFDTPVKNDIKLDTLVICAVDTKEPLIKLQKVESDNKTEFKFIIDITNEDGDSFTFKSIIKSQEQLNQLVQQTIDMLKQSLQFAKYVEDLEECL